MAYHANRPKSRGMVPDGSGSVKRATLAWECSNCRLSSRYPRQVGGNCGAPSGPPESLIPGDPPSVRERTSPRTTRTGFEYRRRASPSGGTEGVFGSSPICSGRDIGGSVCPHRFARQFTPCLVRGAHPRNEGRGALLVRPRRRIPSIRKPVLPDEPGPVSPRSRKKCLEFRFFALESPEIE